MDNHPSGSTAVSTPCGDSGTALLPVGPFTSLHYHFGMLLGVDDFQTDQAYHRGKTRLHNAWLHREGVVWGFRVQINDRRELEVGAGLALDAAGRELHLDGSVCLDIGKWYDNHRNDPELADKENGAFIGHVVVRFRTCLSRPVPSISEPCAGVEADTAYSRTQEQVEVLFVPGEAPVKVLPYHRLRVLFALEKAVDGQDDEVVNRRTQVLSLQPEEQPAAYLEAFRDFAALDELDLHPSVASDGGQTSIFPEDETTGVLLAVVSGTVIKGGSEQWALGEDDPEVDVTVRPAHVATNTIQELLCGPLFAMTPAPKPPESSGDTTSESEGSPPPSNGAETNAPVEDTDGSQPLPQPADAGGPRIDPNSVALVGEINAIRLQVAPPFVEKSLNLDAFSVTTFGSNGWEQWAVNEANASDGNRSLTLVLGDRPSDFNWIRLIVRGTGPTPILGESLVPLAGAKSGPPGGIHDGHDFVLMIGGS